jgi:hypothetical protein
MSAQGQAQRRPGYARRTNPEALKGRNKTSEFKYEQNDDRTSSQLNGLFIAGMKVSRDSSGSPGGTFDRSGRMAHTHGKKGEKGVVHIWW